MSTTEWRACRWADLSEEAKDLLLRMLDYDPAKRITSKQARHPPPEQPLIWEQKPVLCGCLPGTFMLPIKIPKGCL